MRSGKFCLLRSFSGGAPSAAFADEVAADSPFVWYRLAELSGTALSDSSGNGRSATLFGTSGTSYDMAQPSLVGELADKSILFKADTGYAMSNAAFALPVANITGMAVVKIDSGAPAGTIFSPHSISNPSLASGSRDRALYIDSSGKLVFPIWTGTTTRITSAASINDGLPHILHFACGADASEGSELYIDGVSVGTVAAISVDTAGTRYFQIAKSNYSGWPGGSVATLRGIVGEVAWFNSRLSPARIAAHAAAAGL